MEIKVNLTCNMLNKKKQNAKKQIGGLGMNLRRLMVGTLAMTFVVGSSMTAFAEDQTGSATGTGTSVGHLNKEITTVQLPTNTDSVFNYHVDPERVIDLAASLKDGTAVTKNADGVYFKNTGDTYSSSSDAVEFVGNNSVAVDVTVKAEVTASAGGKDIALVADDAALTAAKTPALLMNLIVGTETKAVTSDGATAKAKLDGVPDNFAAKVESGEYKYAVAADADADAWKKTTIKLSGKTNQMDVAADMTAPAIKLTWTIAKHEDYTEETAHGHWSGGALWIGKDSSTGFSSDSLTVEVSDGGTNYTVLASDKYSVNGDKWVSLTWANITEALGGEPSDKAYVRVTDGSTRYVFENN